MNDFNEAYRMAQALCEKDHGAGSWATAHRKRAWYMRNAIAELQKRRAHANNGFFRRIGNLIMGTAL